jgi:hypothetical protein
MEATIMIEKIQVLARLTVLEAYPVSYACCHP